MRTLVLILLAVAALTSASIAAEEKPTADAVVVTVLNEPLPTEDGKKEAFLWNHFANKPEEQKFNSYTAEKWKETFKVFSAALIKKADDRKLDSASLRKALDLVLKNSKGKIAYLPIGAYQTTLDGQPVWIVTVKWEYPEPGEKLQHVELAHIRAFVFDQKTLKQVGFVTCS